MNILKITRLNLKPRILLSIILLIALIVPVLFYQIIGKTDLYKFGYITYILIIVFSLVTIIPFMFVLRYEFKNCGNLILVDRNQLERSHIFLAIISALALISRLFLISAEQTFNSLLIYIPLTFLILDEIRITKKAYQYNDDSIKRHFIISLLITFALIAVHFLSSIFTEFKWNYTYGEFRFAMDSHYSSGFFNLSIIPILYLLSLIIRTKLQYSKNNSKFLKSKITFYVFNIVAALLLIVFSIFSSQYTYIVDSLKEYRLFLSNNNLDFVSMNAYIISYVVVFISSLLILTSNIRFENRTDNEKIVLFVVLTITTIFSSVFFSSTYKLYLYSSMIYLMMSLDLIKKSSEKLRRIYFSLLIVNSLFIVLASALTLITSQREAGLAGIVYTGAILTIISILADILLGICLFKKNKNQINVNITAKI